MKMMISILISFLVNGHAQILMDDSQGTTKSSMSMRSANDIYDMRRSHRVGAGFSALGPSGVAGLIVELNFTTENSFVGGFGMGSDFQAFHLQVKHVFGGNYVSPYLSGGVAHWYTPSPQGNLEKTHPSFLVDRFLTAEKRQSGNFQENILFPAFGIQYVQFSGAYAGASLYAEVDALFDINSLVMVPTGSGGFLYYF